jgi:hypothetical protein
MARWHSANVLQSNAGGRRLWNLSANGSSFNVQEETTLLATEPCPPDVGKDWQTLFRPKLNIAWLPAETVFFRAVQLPPSEPSEIASMVELQLEKLSPLPVTHVVWSYYLMPRSAKPDSLQTVIVIIASRSAVEAYLGELSEAGFQPDRLEAPGLEQFLATKITEDGIWIFPGAAGEPALVAWWYGGTVQNLTMVSLPAGPERGTQLRSQLEQIAWAGELEGWLNGPTRIHLMVGQPDAAFWESAFKDWGDGIEVRQPPTPKELAALSAWRCGTATGTSLLPQEFADRFHQQFVDRLWLRGLVSLLALYILGVLFYFGVLYVFEMKLDTVKAQVRGMGPSYTNALRNIAQIEILKNRGKLKYAALDCWKAVAENLPVSMTLEDMFFRDGKLELRGNIVSGNAQEVGAFNEALRSASDTDHQQGIFDQVGEPSSQFRGDTGEWRFDCTMKGTEKP